MSQRLKTSIHRTCLILTIVLSTIGCDQATKLFARDTLPVTGPLSYLNDNIRFELAYNPGAFLSFGAYLPNHLRFLIFSVGTALAMLALAWYLLRDRTSKPSALLALSLILAGGTGNLIDRLWMGSVTDFLILGIGPLSTGIFNIADVAIVGGTGLLIVLSATSRHSQNL